MADVNVCSSNHGGSDPAAVVAGQVALELNNDFSPNFTGLLEYDLMSLFFVQRVWPRTTANQACSGGHKRSMELQPAQCFSRNRFAVLAQLVSVPNTHHRSQCSTS